MPIKKENPPQPESDVSKAPWRVKILVLFIQDWKTLFGRWISIIPMYHEQSAFLHPLWQKDKSG